MEELKRLFWDFFSFAKPFKIYLTNLNVLLIQTNYDIL